MLIDELQLAAVIFRIRGPIPFHVRVLPTPAGGGLVEIGEVGRDVERQRYLRRRERVIGHKNIEMQASADVGVEMDLDGLADNLAGLAPSVLLRPAATPAGVGAR